MAAMGTWYSIGIGAGLGVAVGVLLAAVVPRKLALVLVVAAAVVGAAIGELVWGWDQAAGGAIGGIAGGFGALPVVAGALRRGGTRGGLALLVGGAAVVTAGLAFVPVVGYLEAVALPAIALRLRAREPERHAGLRTLARD
jgi:hypothetical protein